MKRVLMVSDAHSLRPFNIGTELEIVKVKKEHDYDMLELEDGTWLKGVGDGRYSTDNNELERWAGVYIYETEEIDGEREYLIGELLGYTRV